MGLRYMGKDKGGNGGLIVNIASVCGIDCTQFSTPTYNATKHAVVAFSRSFGVSIKEMWFYIVFYAMNYC